MGSWPLFQKLTKLTLGRLCRQLWLLAGLALLCLVLPALAGRGAELFLSQGVPFSGITLAVTAPEGDPVPELLERYMGHLTDIRQYCRFEAMDYDASLAALKDGGVTAVLVLPENFVQGVQWGENPNVRLIVDKDHPLESMLTLWVGQSASELLAAVQSGIYTVLEAYEQAPPAGLSRKTVLTEINLDYIQWTLNRQELFETKRLSLTGVLPIALHYTLSLFWFLLLSAAPLFVWNFQGRWLAYQRRLRYAGRSPLPGFFGSFLACALAAAGLALPVLLGVLHLPVPAALGTALTGALFFAAYAALCGLLSHTAAGCGALSFLLSAAALFAGGGVIPPVLLPGALRSLEPLSPIAWLRDLTARGLGYTGAYPSFWLLSAGTLALTVLSAWLYCGRIQRLEEGV